MNNKIRYLILAFALLLACGTSMAQESRGAIAGQVTDQVGAVVPGVTVIVTNTETGQSTKLITNESGSYSAPLLAVGVYRIQIEHPGFKKLLRDRIEVGVAARLQIDL